MKLCFSKGYLPDNRHGTERNGEPWNRETVRGTLRIKKLEVFRRLSTDTEAIQSLIGWRLWIYAPSGACWHFDVYLTPRIKECPRYS